MMRGNDGGYGIFGPLFRILILAAVAASIVLLLRWPGRSWQGTALINHHLPERTWLDILKERFARGESTGRSLTNAAAFPMIDHVS